MFGNLLSLKDNKVKFPMKDKGKLKEVSETQNICYAENHDQSAVKSSAALISSVSDEDVMAKWMSMWAYLIPRHMQYWSKD